MSGGKLIAYIGAAILLIFGVLFILATFSAAGQGGWLIVGLILVAIAFGLIWFASRKPKVEVPDNITYQVDLSGQVKLESMKCQSCGGTLTAKDIEMVAGAPVVHCPYCGTSYQLTEEPKW